MSCPFNVPHFLTWSSEKTLPANSVAQSLRRTRGRRRARLRERHARKRRHVGQLIHLLLQHGVAHLRTGAGTTAAIWAGAPAAHVSTVDERTPHTARASRVALRFARGVFTFLSLDSKCAGSAPGCCARCAIDTACAREGGHGANVAAGEAPHSPISRPACIVLETGLVVWPRATYCRLLMVCSGTTAGRVRSLSTRRIRPRHD